MKKIYLTLASAVMLFSASEINAQITRTVRFDRDGVEGANSFEIEAGDTILFRVGSGIDRTITAVGQLPGATTSFGEHKIESGQPGFKYGTLGAGVHLFKYNALLGPDKEITVNVLADGSISTYDVQIGNAGFDNNNYTIELRDTLKFRVTGDVNQTVRASEIPTGATPLNDTLLRNGGPTLHYAPLALGTYTFTSTTSGSPALTTTTTVTVVQNSQPATPTANEESVSYSGITFFPNPVMEEMIVNLNPLYSYELSISTLAGTNVASKNVANANSTSFNVSNLEKGSYVLVVKSNDSNKPKAFKFVKQ